ncbi:MAG TPA: hypothetical protein VI895_02980 [Bdellovibrionota bacterium]|nr:hypothetical protein [Bdellovibrionota bacterium]
MASKSFGVILTTLFCVGWLPGAASVAYLGYWNRIRRFDRVFLPISLSLLLSPALLFIGGHLFPIRPWSVSAWLVVVSLVLLFLSRRYPPTHVEPIEPTLSGKKRTLFLAILAIIFITLTLKLFESQDSSRYFPIFYDYPKHAGVIYALQNHSLPPVNPFFRPFQDIPLSYYYFFHLLPASLTAGGGISTAHAYGLFAFLTAAGFLYALLFWLRSQNRSAGESLAAVGLLALFGGLDFIVLFVRLLPNLIRCSGTLWGCWWATAPGLASGWNQTIASVLDFLTTAGWMPQHLLSTSTFFLVPALILRASSPRRILILAPLWVLTTIGSSIYVGILGFGLLGVWLLARYYMRAIRSVKFRDVFFPLAATLILFATFALEIKPAQLSKTSGFHIGFPSLFYPGRLILSMAPYLVLAFLRPRSLWPSLSSWERALLFVSLGASLFISSTGLLANDFSKNAIFVTYCLMAIVAAPSLLGILEPKKRWNMTWLAPLLFAGLLSSLYETVAYGILRLQTQSQPNVTAEDFSEAARFLRDKTPKDSVVQTPVREFNYLLMLSGRRSVILDRSHGALMNVDSAAYESIANKIEDMFDSLDRRRGDELARELGIDYLFFRRRRLPTTLYPELAVAFENNTFVILKVLPSETAN